jgi:hypothetical protein
MRIINYDFDILWKTFIFVLKKPQYYLFFFIGEKNNCTEPMLVWMIFYFTWL